MILNSNNIIIVVLWRQKR